MMITPRYNNFQKCLSSKNNRFNFHEASISFKIRDLLGCLSMFFDFNCSLTSYIFLISTFEEQEENSIYEI